MGKVAMTDVYRFMTDCLKAAGAGQKPAEQQAKLLLAADTIGHASHGLNRLELYVKDIVTGACTPNNQPEVLKENKSTAWVDAKNVLGATSGHFAMDLAIRKAEDTGVGWISVKGANHYGINGYWSGKAAKIGLIGIALTNTSPLIAPTRSKKAALGTNPLAVVAPGSQGEIFYLDMATSAVSIGKIEMYRRRGIPIPVGWAQGPDGRDTTDPEVALKTRCLMPLGGGENSSGYKGFGLAATIEILCGISAGSSYGHHVRSWSMTGDIKPANLGQCFIAINPNSFAPGFGDRLTECINYWRQLEPTDPQRPVTSPGDLEKKIAEATRASGTITYAQNQITSSAALANSLKVKPLTII